MSIAALALGAAQPGWAQASEDRFEAIEAEAPALMAAMADQAAYCLARRDTNHAVFNGCIDWHSSVHATWALLAYRRAAGDPRFDRLLAQTLTPEGLSEEWALLRRRPGFEAPYGRAWFLRLALENRALGREPDLAPMADDVADGMMAAFRRLERARRGPSPLIASYDNHSWALINMLDYARATGRGDDAREIERWIRTGLVERDLRCPPALMLQSFMAVCANWAAAAMRVLEGAAARDWAARFFALNPAPAPVAAPRSAHHFGLNFSRAWAYWDVYQATGDKRFRALYAEHVAAGAPRENWGGSYRANGHWVAQFGVYALQPMLGGRADAAAAER